MKGAPNAPDGKRSHLPRNRRNRRDKFKGRVRETLAGMKGWRPSASKGPKPVRAPFKRANSCRTSDRSACLFPRVLGPRAHNPGDPWTPGFPFWRNEAPRPFGRAETAPTRPTRTPSAILKTAPALHLHKEDRRNRERRPKDRNSPRRARNRTTGGGHTYIAATLEAGIGPKMKKAL
jgi:hypothetical protein